MSDEKPPPQEKRVPRSDSVVRLLGAALGAYLREQNVPQRRLAQQLGVSESYLSKVLSGGQAASLMRLDEIAAFLGMEFEVHLVKVGTGRLPELVRRGYKPRKRRADAKKPPTLT